MNIKTVVFVETPVFTDYVENLHKTNTIQKEVREKNEHDTCNESANHHNGFRYEVNTTNDHIITQGCMFSYYFYS